MGIVEDMQAAEKYCGRVVLFVGVECKDWTPQQFAELARFARQHRIDTIAPKRADGSIKWYGSPAQLQAERAAVLAEGCGYLPFAYCYGPRFGTKQVDDECAVLAEMMAANDGGVCADLEAEYDGQTGAASRFQGNMRPVPGLLYLTSWADPTIQNFPVGALAPCVNAWIPQDYNAVLAGCERDQVSHGETIIFPALDLTQEFGNNPAVELAATMRQRGHVSLWLWEAGPAEQNTQLLDAVITAFLGS